VSYGAVQVPIVWNVFPPANVTAGESAVAAVVPVGAVESKKPVLCKN
jgi:hypothetical protein